MKNKGYAKIWEEIRCIVGNVGVAYYRQPLKSGKKNAIWFKLFWYKVFVHFDKIKITQSSDELRLKLNINFLMLSTVFLTLWSTIAIFFYHKDNMEGTTVAVRIFSLRRGQPQRTRQHVPPWPQQADHLAPYPCCRVQSPEMRSQTRDSL